MIVVGHDLGTGQPVLAGDQEHALVLGPPRSGKTSGFLAPSVLTHDGPAVVASSKLDVIAATGPARAEDGPVWVLDLGDPGLADQCHDLLARRVQLVGWDPVGGCGDWDQAVIRATVMISARTPAGGGHSGARQDPFWDAHATQLLAALLHAAALAGLPVEDVALWLLTGNLTTPADILGADAPWAAAVLAGIADADPRLTDSVLMTARTTMGVYDSAHARAAACGALMDPGDFLDSGGTLYIVSQSHRQAVNAPVVVGVLDEIRTAAYQRARQPRQAGTVLLALDELSRIAPLHDLPGILADGGSQGVQVLACLQDLSQARARWGGAADGFLTLFRHKVLLGGVMDVQTLRALSALLGDNPLTPTPGAYTQVPRYTVGDLATIPVGRALHIDAATPHQVAVIQGHPTP